MRMWAKKLVRLAAASRAACQGGSSSSSTVRQAKASKRLTVGAALALLQRALIGQKLRALHEEHRERRKAEVGDLDLAATPLSCVGKSRTNGLQAANEGGKSCIPTLNQTFAHSRIPIISYY